MDMDHDKPAPAPSPSTTDDPAREPSRRAMLRRSLGAAAPVVLTLSSAPVAAGQCITASGFVSAAAFHSRPAQLGVLPCDGLSPAEWAHRAPYWPSDVKTNTRFHKAFGAKTLTPGFPESTTLLEVLQSPMTLEAHITAALLNAYRGGMERPFDTPTAVLLIWDNIRANGGFYKTGDPSSQAPAMTPGGTLQWIAMSWEL